MFHGGAGLMGTALGVIALLFWLLMAATAASVDADQSGGTGAAGCLHTCTHKNAPERLREAQKGKKTAFVRTGVMTNQQNGG